jgi:membrane protein DedA with SNARE-associated domain
MDLQAAIDFITGIPSALAYLVLFTSAMVEYVFPPFPGDTVTLAGAVLVPYAGFDLVAVFGAVTAGSLLGSLLVFYAGTALYRWRTRRAPMDDRRDRLAFITTRFERYGAAYIVINRFLPGIRSFIFIAAGLARLSPAKVIAFATLSLLAWNALIVGVGLTIGANIPRIEGLFRQYTLGAWIFVGVVGALVLGRWLWKRVRGSQKPSGG